MSAVRLDTQKIIAEVKDGVGWLTINQPERRNAISMEMWQGIGDALEAFEHDDAVRVVVLSGAGGKAFASGADISEFDKHRSNAEQRRRYGEISGRGNRWLGELTKPMIAMIRRRASSRVRSAASAMIAAAIAPLPCSARPAITCVIDSASAAMMLPAQNRTSPPTMTVLRPIRSERKPNGSWNRLWVRP